MSWHPMERALWSRWFEKNPPLSQALPLLIAKIGYVFSSLFFAVNSKKGAKNPVTREEWFWWEHDTKKQPENQPTRELLSRVAADAKMKIATGE